MSKLIMRLDDACQRRDIEKWNRMEKLLDKYSVRPLVGIIPDCMDDGMSKYPNDENYRNTLNAWRDKNWCFAMHGSTHVYSTACAGINPINSRSEFAGEPLDVQREKLRRGIEALKRYGVEPKVFFAPAHTFDENTLQALAECSSIRVISDTIANSPYKKGEFTFVPQQSGRVRRLPFKYITFCYHPNQMQQSDFEELESFLSKHASEFIDFPIEQSSRGFSIYDAVIRFAYFTLRTLKMKWREK